MNSPLRPTLRKRDLAYQVVVHLLAVVGMVAIYGWATDFSKAYAPCECEASRA